MTKTIFTLIEYSEGGNVSPCSCCTEWEDGKIRITNWNEDSYEEVLTYIARIKYLDEIRKYEYSGFTLIINGHVVDWTETSDVYDNIDFPPHIDGELSEEAKEHIAYVDKFWNEVKERSDKAAEEYKKEEKSKQEKEAARKQQLQIQAAKAEEDRQKAEYQRLKQKFDKSGD